MTIKVVVKPTSPTIQIKATSSGLSANTITIGASIGGGGGATRLSDLVDVDASSPAEGESIIYHANTQLYTVEPITANNIVGPIDGGSF